MHTCVLYISYHSTFHHHLLFLLMLRGDIKSLLAFGTTHLLHNKWTQVDKWKAVSDEHKNIFWRVKELCLISISGKGRELQWEKTSTVSNQPNWGQMQSWYQWAQHLERKQVPFCTPWSELLGCSTWWPIMLLWQTTALLTKEENPWASGHHGTTPS